MNGDVQLQVLSTEAGRHADMEVGTRGEPGLSGGMGLPHRSDAYSHGNGFAFGPMKLLLPGQQEVISPFRAVLGCPSGGSHRARVSFWHQFGQLRGDDVWHPWAVLSHVLQSKPFEQFPS